MNYPNRIREHRERLDWSQERLATATGTSTQQISRLETGQRRLNDDWLGRLSLAMGLRKSDLLVEDGIEDRQPSAGDFVKNDIERGLLSFWRSLSGETQDVVLEMMTLWARRRAGRSKTRQQREG